MTKDEYRSDEGLSDILSVNQTRLVLIRFFFFSLSLSSVFLSSLSVKLIVFETWRHTSKLKIRYCKRNSSLRGRSCWGGGGGGERLPQEGFAAPGRSCSTACRAVNASACAVMWSGHASVLRKCEFSSQRCNAAAGRLSSLGRWGGGGVTKLRIDKLVIKVLTVFKTQSSPDQTEQLSTKCQRILSTRSVADNVCRPLLTS